LSAAADPLLAPGRSSRVAHFTAPPDAKVMPASAAAPAATHEPCTRQQATRGSRGKCRGLRGGVRPFYPWGEPRSAADKRSAAGEKKTANRPRMPPRRAIREPSPRRSVPRGTPRLRAPPHGELPGGRRRLRGILALSTSCRSPWAAGCVACEERRRGFLRGARGKKAGWRRGGAPGRGAAPSAEGAAEVGGWAPELGSAPGRGPAWPRGPCCSEVPGGLWGQAARRRAAKGARGRGEQSGERDGTSAGRLPSRREEAGRRRPSGSVGRRPATAGSRGGDAAAGRSAAACPSGRRLRASILGPPGGCWGKT